MITGYERQHRKGFMYQASEGGDNNTTDQYTRLITHVANIGNIHEQKSRAKEQAAIAGLVLAQPYLDYNGCDPAQGELKLKIWEYNSFIVDPWARDPGFEDAQFFWFQEYISKQEAEARFPDKINSIVPMSGSPQRYGNFYFLPENYNMARNDLMVVSYIWYKWREKKKKLYSRSRNQFFEYSKDADTEMILYSIPDLELVEVEQPTWKLATVLNDQLMYLGGNPIGDIGCPVVPYYWNYDPHVNHFELRVRSLVRTMRSPQVLFNYKVITNNDIAAAVINSGWKRKIGAVANEDNLKKTQAGWDVLINEGYELTDVEKIIPTAVPESDLALAEQMKGLMYEVSGLNMENWAGQQDKQISSLTMLMKQAANLLVFQKYFDQWDYSDKLIGDKLLKVALNNWTAEKVSLYLGEEPTPHFYSRIFSNYQTIVEEADLTPTQQNLQAQQMMDINAAFQREVFPPSMIIPKLNITGKGEIIEFLKQQEQSAQQQQQDSAELQHAQQDAKLKEMYSKSALNIASAKEKYGQFESNIGSMEARISEISKNRALSSKAKMEALNILLDSMHKYGEIEAQMAMMDVQQSQIDDKTQEDSEKNQAYQEANAQEFMSKIMSESGNVNQNALAGQGV